MKRTTGVLVLFAGLLLFAVTVDSPAQSMDVSGRTNGLRLLGYSLFDEDDFFGGTGGGLSYGIAGYLDIGFDVGMLFGEIEDEPAQESRLTFLLRGLLARQSEGFPFTLAADFNYHFALVQESDYLDDQFDDFELIRTGRGYSLGGGAWRDFWLGRAFAIRTGVGASLEIERYTTDVASAFDEETDPPELARYPIENVDRSIAYEGSLGPVIRPAGGTWVLTTLGTFRYYQDGTMEGGAELGITFIRPPRD
jgi:hypothetical protein